MPIKDWLPSLSDFRRAPIAVLLEKGVMALLAAISGVFAADYVSPGTRLGYVVVFFVAAFLLVGLWGWIGYARRQHARPGAPATQQAQLSTSKEKHEDRQALNELQLFAIDRVLPACHDLVALRSEMIHVICPSDTVAKLAIYGGVRNALSEDRVLEFWDYFDQLDTGVSESPGPLIGFEDTVNCIAGLESGTYAEFTKQVIALYYDLHVDKYPNVAVARQAWNTSHAELVADYEKIKRDNRFGKLFRPNRPSRWQAN